MRIGGGIPGTSHSVLVPGDSAPTRWMWDANGCAEIPDAAAQMLMELRGRSPFRIVDAAGMDPETTASSDASLVVEKDDDLRPLGQYTFESEAADVTPDAETAPAAATSTLQSPSKPKPKPKRKR